MDKSSKEKNPGSGPRNNQKGKGKGGRGGRGGGGRGRGRGRRGNPNNNNNNNNAQEKVEGDTSDVRQIQATKGAKANQHAGEKKQTNGKNKNRRRKGGNDKRNKGKDPTKYPEHWGYEECMKRYVAKDGNIVRGKLRVLPAKDGMGFCACDRGSQKRDVMLESSIERNRGMNGDTVFIELLPVEEEGQDLNQVMDTLTMDENHQIVGKEEEGDSKAEMWQDDEVQMKLWNPAVPIRRIKTLQPAVPNSSEGSAPQRKGSVVHVCAPAIPKDLPKGTKHRRIMVGTLKTLPSGTCLFTPNDRTLPQFKCSNSVGQEQRKRGDKNDSSDLYKAEYIYDTWEETHSWPPCVNVQRLGDAFSIEDQIQGLLMENRVDHGEFPPEVLKDVEDAVQSGVYLMEEGTKGESKSAELGWKPTPEMYAGRRDYRKERIFTIDPSTAKDLDDALHIKELPDGSIELGVHIADVSAFVAPGTAVDKEALRRATTVYLVDRTVPMLPRPLCEVACSLNENVERLAFSCVWKMGQDGSLECSKDVWYGRTVIKSCARLDYSTAQNIIDKKVATGEDESAMDDELWPKSRRPTGGHTIEQVAADVRLMHRVAMARRRLRFSNGALALHGVKLTFQLDEDGETPLRCAPYPIKDSNRLVEEYMLLANYLVAQRLITHAGDRAVLRRHPEPLPDGLQKVVDVAKSMFDFHVDASSSASLHSSLVQLGSVCNDETFLKCMTQMLTTPMQNADYMAAGAFERELWKHFALNIPYYTHFTSPIRRYPDVLVHRLLQATIDGQEAVDKYPLDAVKLQIQCEHCNEKRLASKMAQERCDVVFLALYLRRNTMKSELGVVMSIGNKAFTVFVPSLGVNGMVFLDEHAEWLDYSCQGEEPDRRIILTCKPGSQGEPFGRWSRLQIKMFTKVLVTCGYKDKPRVDVKLLLEGPAPSNS